MTIRKSMFLLLALCSIIFAQEKPKVAVYSTGGKNPNENKMLSNKMTNALVSSGKYLTIERSDAFLEQVATEQAKQREGTIDDKQISRIGKQSGADYVCIAEMVEAFGGHQISARIVNVETVAVTVSGEAYGTLNSIQAFDDIANNVIASMFGLQKKAVNTTAATVPVANMPMATPSKGKASNITGTLVPGSSLADKLAWLQRSAESHNTYIIEVNADENIAPQTLKYEGAINITIVLRGVGTNRTIRLKSNGIMFIIKANVTLILDNNITLKGHSGNADCMVWVESGIFKMNNGSAIIGNTRVTTNSGGAGVHVSSTFEMNGGIISGNTVASHGGGVTVTGTFTMNDGIISGNTAPNNGGGVYVIGAFNMNGGTISGNVANNGGGVYVDGGTFNMRGGTIASNTAREYGGGVCRKAYSGYFTKTGGIITGYNSDKTSGNTVNDGSGAVARRGHAVYVSEDVRKEITAGPEVKLSREDSKTGWDN